MERDTAGGRRAVMPLGLVHNRPDTVAGALELLAEHGEDAIVYAGGTELILLAKLGFVAARQLVGVGQIAELGAVAATADAGIRLGAAVTHSAVRRSVEVTRRWPVLAQAVGNIGNLRVQAMGTIGGNLCFADPQSDVATCLVALDGLVGCVGRDGRTRTMPVEEFIVDAYSTALRAGEELLSWIELPPCPPHTVAHYDKVVFEERPVAAAGARLRLDNDGAIAEAALVVGAMTPRPMRSAASDTLIGARPADMDRAQLGEVARGCAADAVGAALAGNRTPFMEAVTVDLIERVLNSVVAQCAAAT